MSSGGNDQANVLKFAAFRDQGWGHVALWWSDAAQTIVIFMLHCIQDDHMFL